MASSPFDDTRGARITQLAHAHPRTNDGREYAYGTSGFRGPASTLPAVTLRMGMLAAMRSAYVYVAHTHAHADAHADTTTTTTAPYIGVMVTASHNDAPDNGIKLVDPSGEMLTQEWEELATRIANVPEAELATFLQHVWRNELRLPDQRTGSRIEPRVIVGQDTRASSPMLTELVVRGAQALGAHVHDYGVVTTPLLHWCVWHVNTCGGGSDSAAELTPPSPPPAELYYSTLSTAFLRALAVRDRVICNAEWSDAAALRRTLTMLSSSSSDYLPSHVLVDCSNGVGSLALAHFQRHIQDALPVTTLNTSTVEHLNDHAGAEHVQKSRSLPRGAADAAYAKLLGKCASLDGDADRLVYYYVDDSGVFHLLDGDKIICLCTLFLLSLLRDAGLLPLTSGGGGITTGIVQTAYANGASTAYIRATLGLEPLFTPTGVKHLHHRAAAYDVGVYFESNGHGTVLFSEQLLQRVRNALREEEEQGAANDAVKKEANKAKKMRALQCLLSLSELVNQCVGDAISDMLLVEVALFHMEWTLREWNEIYTDLPSVMLKVKVLDRSVITTTDAERKCVTPAGLQDAIDEIVRDTRFGPVEKRRSFVRPSGTEDVVRVYAEASTMEEARQLARDVEQAVMCLAGGIA